MASGVNDRERRSEERAGHASCSQFTGYTEQAGASGDSKVSENISREMEESLVFMLGIRGATTVILWAAGTLVRQKLKVGRGGGGRVE